MKVQTKNFINGRWQSALNGDDMAVENPSDGTIITAVPASTQADADAALTAAQSAFPAWSKRPAPERAQILSRVAELLRERVKPIAAVISMEQGKPIGQASGEVLGAAHQLDYHAQWARRIEGETVISDNPGEHIMIARVAVGVVCALIPWNFPLSLICRKVGPALVAGNTVVVKPHEITPLCGLMLAALFEEAGTPAGVINFVTGNGLEVGQALVENPITQLVTLTGSVRAGRQVMQTAAQNITQVSLELGGKAPFIVCSDADLDKAVELAVFSRFRNCGQVCTSNERTLVHSSMYQEFSEKLAEKLKMLVVDTPDKDPDMGPKVSLPELEKVLSMVTQAQAEGAELVVGGLRSQADHLQQGHFMQPTLLTNVTPSMTIAKEEVFGPVISLIEYSDFDEAIAIANDSDYGLTAYLMTDSYSNVMKGINEISSGEIFVNRVGPEAVQGYHTGYRLSGIGGDDGKHGFEAFMKKKTIYLSAPYLN
ncbi:MAG: aldehyde dehydrogenase [Rhodobacteraceae bacterium]|nr:aldehyde dehydrogenase [Paracoccaceae bacterium]